MLKRILCIDDIPEEKLGELTLEKTLKSMFKGKYELLFEKNPQKAYELIKNDPTIKLVFLDIDFNGDPLGPQIADVLRSINPDLKVVVLTSINRHGEKIRFGKKANVRKYVTKKELQEDRMKTRVVNLSEALIEDPYNKNWSIVVDDENETITLDHKPKGFGKTFNVPSKRRQKILALLYACCQRPNECIKSIEMDGFVDDPVDGTDKYVNEVVYETNVAVREASEWMTWGILDSLGCGTSEVKLVIGRVGISEDTLRDESKNYDALLRQYSELNARVRKIEELLKIKKM